MKYQSFQTIWCFILLLFVFIVGFTQIQSKKRLRNYTTAYSSRKSKIIEAEWINGSSNGGESVQNRGGKFFPFFALVSFPESSCIGANDELGVCLSSRKCVTVGGSDVGSCAQGYGTCCFVSSVCGTKAAIINSNGTHLIQPSPFREICRYEIPKQAGICQVRLDFLNFRIDEGEYAELLGDCTGDTLTVSGASNGIIGPICGDMTGQHMYLDYENNDKIIVEIFQVMDTDSKWDIKVTYIKCGAEEKAPVGCLQYYTQPRGTIKSFNFINMHQLNNEDYTVCVRTNLGMNKITWKTCGGNNDFVISGPPNMGLSGESQSGDSCLYDWVMILGVNKYCGNAFPTQPVTTSTKPFILQVHFNEFEKYLPPPVDCGSSQMPCQGGGVNPNLPPPDDENTGFCLMYSQSP